MDISIHPKDKEANTEFLQFFRSDVHCSSYNEIVILSITVFGAYFNISYIFCEES